MSSFDSYMPGGSGGGFDSFGGDWASDYTGGSPTDSPMTSGGDYAAGF